MEQLHVQVAKPTGRLFWPLTLATSSTLWCHHSHHPQMELTTFLLYTCMP